MKCIIAGGRGFIPSKLDYKHITSIIKEYEITEIISGGAKGADSFGEDLALKLHIKLKIFPADWNKYGKKAGYLRNKQMGDYTDMAILMPGGVGTNIMRDIMHKLNKEIIYDAKSK